MPGRQSSVARRVVIVIGIVTGAASLLQSGLRLGRAFGQERPPTLPPTRVEAEPVPAQPTTAPPAPQPPPTPPPSAGASISAGGVFASPAAAGYRAGSSTTGTIIDVPQLDFPGVVTVVPSQVIADQQAIRFDDILRDIPSAVKSFDNGFRPDAFILRGFEVRARDYRWNGYQDFSPAPRDFFNVQRVEVLQGPASVLYGSGQPSGLINIITKKPLGAPLTPNDNSFAYGDVQVGSFGLFRTTADVYGPVDWDVGPGTLLVRVNTGYMNTESFRNFGFEDRVMFAPALTYVWDEDTALTYEFQYLRDHRLFDTGVVALGGQPTTDPNLIAAGVGVVGGNPALMSRRVFLGQPGDFQTFDDYKTALTLVHNINDDWSTRIGGFIGWHDSPAFATQPILFGNDPRLAPLAALGVTFPATTVLREATAIPNFSEQNYDVMANLAGKVETGCITHKLLFGYEFDYFNSTNFTTLLSDPFITFPSPFGPLPIGASSPIDVLSPNYGVPTPPLPGRIEAAVTQARNGFYAQDNIELSKQWKVLCGVRYDIVDEAFHESLSTVQGGVPMVVPPTTIDEHSYFVSPRVGLVYQPIEDVLSFYGLYSESFDPAASGIFVPGTQLRPETGKSGEGGMKVDLLDKALSVTASGFSITKDNVVTQRDFIFSTQIGQQRAQGAELNIVGHLTDQWSVIGNYAYVDSRITQAALAAEIGQRFRGVPYNLASLWTRYNLVQDCCQTLGVALGMLYVGNRPGDLVDSFSLPGYTRWDAGVYYQRGYLNAGLYFENIFDRQYYVGSLNDLAVFPGAPFTVRATVGITF
jgi:iron complex outermembrane receptor protein